MMHMTFYWSNEVTLLVNLWHTKTWLSYSLSLLACLIASVFYQYLENLRMRLKALAAGVKSNYYGESSANEPLIHSKFSGGKWSAASIAGAVLFGVNSGIGYLLMLAVMSFNGGVLVAVIVGLAIGYLLFRSSDDNLVVVDSPCGCA